MESSARRGTREFGRALGRRGGEASPGSGRDARALGRRGPGCRRAVDDRLAHMADLGLAPGEVRVIVVASDPPDSPLVHVGDLEERQILTQPARQLQRRPAFDGWMTARRTAQPRALWAKDPITSNDALAGMQPSLGTRPSIGIPEIVRHREGRSGVHPPPSRAPPSTSCRGSPPAARIRETTGASRLPNQDGS